MKKKLLAWVLAGALCTLTGCAGTAEETMETGGKLQESNAGTEEAMEETTPVSDQEAADRVAKLIDAIYVQTRNEQTDARCKEAKKAWDALTDAQKELVWGENADPDYFGLDTGDALADDPLNADGIGEKELLVVSFGTSFNDSRAEDIGGVEKNLAKGFPDWSVRRAFTSQIIINHIQARDGVAIDNVDQALDRAVANGVKELTVLPTHLMYGSEYDDLKASVDAYRNRFERVVMAEPLLGQVGSDASEVNEDKRAVSEAVVREAVKDAGYQDLASMDQSGAALVLLGHGTSHRAAVTYYQVQAQMAELGYSNVFVGTVEGKPEETSCENIMEAVIEAGYSKVILRPFMVVAGDHANNDMAGEEDSWKSTFDASGKFEEVSTQIAGLGRIDEVKEIYASHAQDAIESIESMGETSALTEDARDEVPEDGEYLAEFSTDSGMFHVNEAKDGKGELTVKDGKMTIHISLTSRNIRNLYPGLAKDAEIDKEGILEPTTDTVTYSDGMTEEVSGFDVPVPALDQEFDLALYGSKGKWYDHKVKVFAPVKIN